MLDRYLVKDKYTYERIWQTDFSYNKSYFPYSWANGYVLSHNYIPYFYIAESDETLIEGIFSAEKPIEKAISKEFSQVSGFRVTVKTAAEKANFRVTFFGANGESYSSVGDASKAKEKGLCFSTLNMGFTPIKVKAESDGGDVDAVVETVFVWDTVAQWGGQAHFYTAEGEAKLSDKGASMVLSLRGEGGFETRELPMDKGGCYSMKMPLRNTVYMVIKNRAGAKNATFAFTSTDAPEWSDENSVTLLLSEDELAHAYYFNLSECPGQTGRLKQWKLIAEGDGELEIVSYSYEQEKACAPDIVTEKKAVADVEKDTVKITGKIDLSAIESYKGGKLNVYISTMADDKMFGRRRETTSGKRFVGGIDMPETENFTIDGIKFHDDKTTLLMYEFLLFAEKDGKAECLCPRFFIENYECIEGNTRYAFDLPDFTVNVLERGAAGDGIADDTEAIQSAIDEVHEAGGGRVFLPGAEGIYGRRYIVTNLLMRDYVELHLGDGAVIWQSQRAHDYTYEPSFAHDGVIPGINWTHQLHVSNLPLIQGANIHHVKITGHGAIRSMDVGSEEGVDMPGYAVGCYRRIHVIPLGMFLCDCIEYRDIEVVRSNNYNIDFNKCRYIYVGNVRCHEVKCVSGDGYGVGSCKHVHVNRCFLQSNDDGIVMTVHFIDPRGLLWWTNIPGEDGSVDDIRTTHCYINSGGGKCLAFIPWGTNDPNQEMEEIRNIYAEDNFLVGVNPVGAWYDNPYNGKQPFDNTETDDYSPVKNVRILKNRYAGNCNIGPIQATNFITDCGVTATSQPRNGSFTLGGLSNWTTEGDADTVIYCGKEKGRIRGFDKAPAWAAQGLHLETGRHTATFEILTTGLGAELFAADIETGEILASEKFVVTRIGKVSFSFEIKGRETEDVFIGVRSCSLEPDDFIVFDCFELRSEVDHEAIEKLRTEKYEGKIYSKYERSGDFRTICETGNHYVATDGYKENAEIKLQGEADKTVLKAAFKINGMKDGAEGFGYGFRFAIRDGGKSYRELRFNIPAQTLTLKDVCGENITELYRRESFFFTSLDFHEFKLDIGEKSIVLWVDGSMYGTADAQAEKGTARIFIKDLDATLNL